MEAECYIVTPGCITFIFILLTIDGWKMLPGTDCLYILDKLGDVAVAGIPCIQETGLQLDSVDFSVGVGTGIYVTDVLYTAVIFKSEIADIYITDDIPPGNLILITRGLFLYYDMGM